MKIITNNNNLKIKKMSKNIMLSSNFSLNEMLRNNHNVINNCNAAQLDNLIELTHEILQPLRNYMSSEIIITSGFRNEYLNQLVNGVHNSEHLTGCACDFICNDMLKAFVFIISHLEFNQLIWEGGNDKYPKWIHVSFNSKIVNKRQVLYKFAKN